MAIKGWRRKMQPSPSQDKSPQAIAAETKVLRRRLIYLRGRVPELVVERKKLRDESGTAYERLKTMEDGSEKKALQIRISYLRQRLDVLNSEWTALVTEDQAAVRRLKDTMPSKPS
jgi:hypothetical protein